MNRGRTKGIATQGYSPSLLGTCHPLFVTPEQPFGRQPPKSLFSHVGLVAAPKIILGFSLSPILATIKPPDVTCIPKVRSIQMLIHPTLTPIRSENGHQLTLEEIFRDLFYRLELRVNHTYQMVNIGHSPCLLESPLLSQEYWAACSKSDALYKTALPKNCPCRAPRILVESEAPSPSVGSGSTLKDLTRPPEPGL